MSAGVRADPVGRAGDTLTLPIRFQVAERSLWTANRRVLRVGFGLADLLRGRAPAVPVLAEDEDGVDLRSIPAASVDGLCAADHGLLGMVRQRYPRHFIRLGGTFEEYLQAFSGKSRSTLNRKRKRWVAASGGLHVEEYHTPDRIAAFATAAGGLSARTYQARLLGAGLPVDAASLAEMRERAARGRMRGYVLHHRGRPAAFLYLPVEEATLIYAHLGYEPELADLSPGSVLQLEALRRLFGEPGLRLFDFTEGDGAHKRLFGREEVACADLLLLRPSWRNRMLATGLPRFDRLVAAAGRRAEASGIKSGLKRWLRG